MEGAPRKENGKEEEEILFASFFFSPYLLLLVRLSLKEMQPIFIFFYLCFYVSERLHVLIIIVKKEVFSFTKCLGGFGNCERAVHFSFFFAPKEKQTQKLSKGISSTHCHKKNRKDPISGTPPPCSLGERPRTAPLRLLLL